MPFRILLLLAATLWTGSLGAQKKKAESPAPKGLPSSTFSCLDFRSVGPAVTSGRIADFAVHPQRSGEYYVAAASGGIWKTTNRGVTYTPVFDGEGSYSIGCLAIDPSKPYIVWAGTGENNNQRSVAYGDGIYKSTDSGKSWKRMGLEQSEHIARIVVHPSNSDIVYVASYGPLWKEGGERGVYKTTDGGKSWTCVKAVSAYTGCNDLIMDPRDPDVLYAAFHQRMRKVFTYIGGGPESAVYRTRDGGATWEKVEGGLPGGELGRIGLAISPVNPDILYAVVEGREGKGGIYCSEDAGHSWEKRNGFQTSGNYYQEITCDPHDAKRIYITDTFFKVSHDGGRTVENLGELNKHIDNHAIWIDPEDPGHLLVGCDGGVYETWDFAATWHFKANLPVTQFYKVEVDQSEPFYHIHGGTQDNLSMGGPSRTLSINGITNDDWYVTSTGDGFESQVDPTNPDIVYAQSQYGGLVRFDRRSGEFLPIRPVEPEGEPAYRWNWDAPLLISQHDPRRLYFGANKLLRSDDRGNSWKTVSGDLSRQIDRNAIEVMGRIWSVDAIAKNGSTDIYGQLTTIAESPFDEKVIWVGTDDGLIQLTTDGGATWKSIDRLPGVPDQSYVGQIIASRHDRQAAYVCFNHHRYGDFRPFILRTGDMGKTWQSISSGLPERGSVYTMAEDHADPKLLFAGTEFGVFATQDRGASWIQMKSGLPTIAVRDIAIQRKEDDLVLATFGRGFYVLDDYSPLRHFHAADTASEALILPVQESVSFIPSYPYGLRDKAHQGSSFYTAPNPEPGATFTWYLKEDVRTIREKRRDREKALYTAGKPVHYPPADSLRLEDRQEEPYILLTIRNDRGEFVRHIREVASAGLHRTTWDFRYPTPAPVHDRYVPAPDVLFGDEERGHPAPPGDYTVSLSLVEDGVLRELVAPVPFRFRSLNLQTLPADPQEALAFHEQVSRLRKAASAATDLLHDMEQRLQHCQAAVQDISGQSAPLIREIHDARMHLHELSVRLEGDRSLASREFETPPSITDRVGGIQGALWNSTAEIPQTYRDSYETASRQLRTLLGEMRSADQTLDALERKLELSHAPYTPGRWPDWE